MTAFVQLQPKKRIVELSIDGRNVQAAEGTTILDACRQLGEAIPTLCYLDTLHPVNVCRVCVVELEGSRVLVPACSRKVAASLSAAAALCAPSRTTVGSRCTIWNRPGQRVRVKPSRSCCGVSRSPDASSAAMAVAQLTV